MLRYFRLTKRFRFWRWVHLVSAVFVFSYIAFDVLDLDLSNFPLKHAPRERAAIITEAPKATELVNTVNSDGFRIAPLLLQPSIFKESIRIQQKDLLRTSRFRKARILFRPRIVQRSTSDSSPSA